MFKKISKEERILIQKYTYYPSQSKFLQIKKILENAEPDPEIRDMECYKDFVKVLPTLKTSFIVRYALNSDKLDNL